MAEYQPARRPLAERFPVQPTCEAPLGQGVGNAVRAAHANVPVARAAPTPRATAEPAAAPAPAFDPWDLLQEGEVGLDLMQAYDAARGVRAESARRAHRVLRDEARARGITSPDDPRLAELAREARELVHDEEPGGLAALLPDWEREASVEVPACPTPGLVLGVGARLQATLGPQVGPIAKVLADRRGVGGKVGVRFGMEAAVSGSAFVRVGTGFFPGLDVGVRVQLTLAASCFAGAQGEVTLRLDPTDPGAAPWWELDVMGGVQVDLCATGDVVPYVRFPGGELDWPLTLVTLPIATWGPRYTLHFNSVDLKPEAELSHVDDLDVHGLERLIEGSGLGAWLADTDEQVARELTALGEAGKDLAELSPERRAASFAALRDGWVDVDHQPLLLELLAAEPTVEARWALLRRAYLLNEGEPAPGDAALADWGRSALWRLLGPDLGGAFDRLMARAP